MGWWLAVVATAWARPEGMPANGAWGVFDCGQCHGPLESFLDLAAPEVRPEIQVRADGPLVSGVPVRLMVTVETAVGGSERVLGFAMRAAPSAPLPELPEPSGAFRPLDPRTRLFDFPAD
ncbi:MAG: hypothetical protein AAF602_20745, partial [Myxococcota bacterium]